MLKDIASDLNVQRVQAITISSSTTTYSTSIDTKDMDTGAFLAFLCTAYTDGSYAITLQDSADNSSFADLATGQYNGGSTSLTVAAATAALANMPKLGASGNRRYLRAKIVSTTVTTGAAISVIAVVSNELSPI